MKPPPMHPNPPGLDLVDDGPFWIRVMDHEKGGPTGAGNAFEGHTTFTATPMPYRKAWGHRYEVTIDACPWLPPFLARVGPGNQFTEYRAGGDTIELGERFYVDLLDRKGTKDTVPTASELHAAIIEGLAPHGITEITFG